MTSGKFLFLIPPTGNYRRDERCQSDVEAQTAVVVLPPVDLALYAAIVRQAGYEAAILDCAAEQLNVLDAIHFITSSAPDILFLPITWPTEKDDFTFVGELREQWQGQVWIKGGRAFHDPQQLLNDWPVIDAAFTGEVEPALSCLCQNSMVLSGKIPGIAFRDETSREIICTPATYCENLSELPLPARDLLKNELYINPANRRKMTVIHGHRGCPGHCIFCPAPIVEGRTVRFRSVDHMMKELEECIEKFGLTDFLFHGDTFTVDSEWLTNLCHKIRERGWNISWGCNSRVEIFQPLSLIL